MTRWAQAAPNDVVAWDRSNTNGYVLPDFYGAIQISGGPIFSGAVRMGGSLSSPQLILSPADLLSNYPPLTNIVSVSVSSISSEYLNGAAFALSDAGRVLNLTNRWTYSSGFPALNPPAGLSNVVAVAAGFMHGVALKSDGRVVAWGENANGKTNPPPGLSNVVAIAAGHQCSFALRADGTITNWGSFVADMPVPSEATNVVAIGVGLSHAVVLRADGRVFAWGLSYYPDLYTVPANATNVVAISCGEFYTLALKADGSVVWWGDATYGHFPPPVWLTNVVAVAAGGTFPYATGHALAIVSDHGPIPSVPLQSPEFGPAGFRVRLASECGRVYRLEYVTVAGGTNWTALPLVAGNGGTLQLFDPTATNGPARFYRVRRW